MVDGVMVINARGSLVGSCRFSVFIRFGDAFVFDISAVSVAVGDV
jgi:hypothetical protein